MAFIEMILVSPRRIILLAVVALLASATPAFAVACEQTVMAQGALKLSAAQHRSVETDQHTLQRFYTSAYIASWAIGGDKRRNRFVWLVDQRLPVYCFSKPYVSSKALNETKALGAVRIATNLITEYPSSMAKSCSDCDPTDEWQQLLLIARHMQDLQKYIPSLDALQTRRGFAKRHHDATLGFIALIQYWLGPPIYTKLREKDSRW